MHCAFEITINGYYDEALILMRSVLEHFLILVFLSRYPDNLEELVLTGIKTIPAETRKNGPKFNATNLLTNVLKVKKRDDKVIPIFDLLSTFSHGKKSTLIAEYQERRAHQKMTPIKIEHCYDEQKSKYCIGIFINFQHLFFRSIMTLFSTEINNATQFASKLSDLKNTDKVLEDQAKHEQIKELIDNACPIFLGTNSAVPAREAPKGA